ncbi:uncharacterized protein LOC110233295 isoform X1, partial [Paramuricea clavata]
MPERCVVYGCNNTARSEKGVSLYRIPYCDDNRQVAKGRRKKWLDFIRRKRDQWTPSSGSVVCSKHFTEDCFEYGSHTVPLYKTPKLKRDEIGITAVPSLMPKATCLDSERNVRLQRRGKLSFMEEGPSTSIMEEPAQFGEQSESIQCGNCESLLKRNRQLRINWLSAKHRLEICRNQMDSQVESQLGNDSQDIPSSNDPTPASKPIESNDEHSSSDIELPTSDDLFDEEAPMESTETETEDETNPQHKKVFNDSNLRREPKFIVFFTQLLTLFKFCHACKFDHPLIDVQENGTMAEVTSTCANPKCGRTTKWFSQPYMTGTKIPAGNFLLSFAILVAGTSATKVLRVFNHMGLKCISLSTFFKHQREKLFPGIFIHWKKYQEGLIQELKNHGDLVVAGDGRHDSMGHSAKYCAYTVFCCTVPFIIHFALVQRNEAGSSTAMEYHGFVRSMEYLLGCGLLIKTFVSDRHTSIAKHMREKLANIKQYFDIWHLKKKVTKVLTKLAKVSGNEIISEWIKPCTNHLYWSARTTQSGNGDVIWAKFSSFFSHVVNKHKNLTNLLFDKCAHADEIHPRKWMDEGSIAYEKMLAALTNKKLMNVIKKASPIGQTSCLEGFHSVLNQFSPKMIGYSYPGMFC